MYINWKKTFMVTLDVVLAAYIILAVTSFNRPDRSNIICEKVRITIADKDSSGFLSALDVKKQLTDRHLYPKGKQLSFVDLRAIESTLMENPFINTAECYKTEDGNVGIIVTQRLPLLRVKGENGDDYYRHIREQSVKTDQCLCCGCGLVDLTDTVKLLDCCHDRILIFDRIDLDRITGGIGQRIVRRKALGIFGISVKVLFLEIFPGFLCGCERHFRNVIDLFDLCPDLFHAGFFQPLIKERRHTDFLLKRADHVRDIHEDREKYSEYQNTGRHRRNRSDRKETVPPDILKSLPDSVEEGIRLHDNLLPQHRGRSCRGAS